MMGRIYHDKEWHRARYKCLKRYPVCEACRRIGGTTPSSVADHMIPAVVCEKYGYHVYDQDNLVGMCKKHHDQVTREFDKPKRYMEFTADGIINASAIFMAKYNVALPMYDADGFLIMS